MLHITNGHSAGILQTGLPGDVLYWVDVLHEGPTPANPTLDMKPDRLLSLFPTPHDVTEPKLKLAKSADRSGILRLLSGDTSALPYLEGPLTRHLAQFPSKENGLSRSEQQILEILSAGVAGTRQRLAITPAGQDVLAGRADAIALNGIDRWLGGVHLSGKEASDAHRR